MSNPAQEETQTETKSVNNSRHYPRWLEPVSVVIFWAGLGATLYVCFLPSIWHFFTAALVLTYHVLWIQKKKFSVLPRSFLALTVDCSAYKILYENFVVTPKKRTGLYNWMWCAHLFLLITYVVGHSVFTHQNTEISIEDMQTFHGRYESLQRLGSRNLCGDYIITFRQDDGCEISFYTSLPGQIENSKELFALWGMQGKLAECRKYLRLKQVIGTKYQSLYNPERVKKTHKVMLRIFFTCLSISICLYLGFFIIAQLTKPKASLSQNDTE